MHANAERAKTAVNELASLKTEPERILALLREVAADPVNLNWTPYLITELRDAGFWPALHRAATEAA